MKNKIISFAKKYDYIFAILIILITVIPKTINTSIEPYDQLWVFGNIYKLSIGQIIYKDVNIITTPIFYELGSLIFKLFGRTYITFFVYNIITCTILYFVIYRITRTIKLPKLISILFLTIILGINDSFAGLANYNQLSMLFFLIGMLLAIKEKDKKTSNIKQAICIMLVLMTNQKLGAGYVISYIIYEIMKEKSLKEIFKTGIVACLILMVFIVYEYLTNNLSYFIDLCLGGMGEFKDNIKAEKIDVVMRYTAVIALAFISGIIVIKNIKDTKKISTVKTLLAFSIGALILTYPIFNVYHFSLAIIPSTITLMYSIYVVLEELLAMKPINKIIKITALIFVLVIVGRGTYYTIQYCKSEKASGIFYGTKLDNNIKRNIEIINDYIIEKQKEGKNIVIISTYSMLYTLENNIDNYYFDMPLRGNLGKNGVQKMIDKINNYPAETIFLVENEERSAYKIYQYQGELRDYVEENYSFVQELENYDVYEK